MKIVRKLFFFFVAFCLGFTIQGQTEEELVVQANALFKEEKFVDATPLFLRLLSLQPKNATYNFKYGACLLFNSNKKNEAIRYLKFATENPTIEPEAFYYMGRAYHLNYLFNDAVRSYDKYASLVDKKLSTKYDVPRLVEMCQNGRKLLANYSEIVVFEKKEIEADKFFRLYDLKEIGGSILVTADFQSKLDKKKNHIPLVYFPKSATEIYYSSYGDGGENGKEIYRRIRKPSGGWDEPELVKGGVNTKFDEDFAYRSQDGRYLFFCSKGHNSMGGYDVFRSEYNPTTDSFLAAENMDFAISSPDDDLFFLVDQKNENGYFASSRQSETGKLFVYKIRVEKLPAQLNVIAGRFESKLKPIGTKIFIEVHDAKTDALVGEFNSDEAGKVILTFPAGGEYKYLMKLSDDTQIYSQSVTIPDKKSIKPLRQNILHYVEEGKEVIHISNRFDEVVAEKEDILADLFSEKAQLEPNAQKYNLDQLNILGERSKILAEVGASGLSLSEVAANLVNRANEVQHIEKNAAVFEQKTAFQIEKEVEKIKEIDRVIAKNMAAFKTAETNSLSSKNLVLETRKLLSERKIAADKIEDFLSVNEQVQANTIVYLTNQKSTESWNQLGLELRQLLEEDKNSEALTRIAENREVVKSAMELFIDDFQNKTSREIGILNQALTDISQKKYSLETSSKDLQTKLDFMEKNLNEGKSNDPDITAENIALKRAELRIIDQKITTLMVEQAEKRNLKELLENQLSEFLMVENSPKPISVANLNKAKDSRNSLKEISVNYQESDLAEEIKNVDNENLMASVSSQENEPIGWSVQEWNEVISPKYDQSILEIKNNSNLSDPERWSQLIATNDDVLLQLETEKEKRIAAGQTEELAALNKIQAKITEENSQINLNLMAASEESSDLITRMDENYEQSKEDIANNNSLAETEREQQLIALNQALLTNLAKEKSKFIALGKENPDNLVVQAKIEEIDQIEAEYAQLLAANHNRLKDLESTIAQNSNPIAPQKSAFSRMNFEEQESDILNQVNSDYKKEVKKISKSKESENVRLTQLLALEKDLITALNNEKATLAPQNQADEIAAIERIEIQTTNLIAEQETKLAELKNQLAGITNTTNTDNSSKSTNTIEADFSTLSVEEQEAAIFAKINPTYMADKKRIDASSSTEKERLLANLNLDKAYLNDLAEEKEKLNKTTQEAEFEAIKRIEEVVNTVVASNELKLLAVPESETEFIARLAKDYQANKDLLTNNQGLSEKEKAKRQIGVDEALLESLKKEMQKFNALSSANPSVSALEQKAQFIAETIERKKSEIAQLQSIINKPIAAIENQPNAQASVADQYKVIDDFRAEFLGSTEKGIMEQEITTRSIETLKSEKLKLESYENQLLQLERQFQASETSLGENQGRALKLVQTELIAVGNKKRQYSITIGDLEREFIAENKHIQNESNFKIDHELEEIRKEEQALAQKLDGDITSMKEIKKIEKQLVKLADQKAGREVDILKQATKETQKENQKKLEVLGEVPTTTVSERVNLELAQSRAIQLDNESKILEEQAKRTKDNETASQLMEKAFAKQKKASEIIEIAYVDNSVAKIVEGKISTLSTRNDLELRKASLRMDESNVNAEIKNVESELNTTKNESEEKLLRTKRNELSKERDLILNQIIYVDKKINLLPQPSENSIDPTKKETELSYAEEVKISSSLEYREISKIASDVFFIENEISFLLKSIEEEKRTTRKVIETGLFDENQVNQSEIDARIKSIQEKENRLVILKDSFEEKKRVLAAKMPFEDSKTNKIENLLLRGIEPIASDFSDYVSIPKDGFRVDLIPKNTDKNSLTIETEKHRGLMFRVQVGAFSKPLEHAFEEFSPVTGEKRTNGLVVYMAGYFDKSTRAAEAQKMIRSLGYSDAFVVAYCDGERISLSEGRKLESTNACIPIQLSELTINRTVPDSPKDTTKLVILELDYHKAPGAASAAPVEMKKGLFYTVQIGVYNRPVGPGTLKNLSPLITKRLPNGQIRYSAGIFASIEEAMPKRKEAIEKGISDAFITAYYGSERISLTEAENLLREKGKGIIEKTAIGMVKEIEERQVAEEKLQEAIVEDENKKFVDGRRIQLVSKQQFEEFPRDRLNRFNKHVSFYFDQNDRRLKSVVFSNIEDIPQIHFLRDEVDTVYFTEGDKMQIADENGFKKIVFVVQNGNLDGDVADYLFRLSFRKEFVEQGDRMKVVLHDVPSDAIQPISDQLRTLKIQSSVE